MDKKTQKYLEQISANAPKHLRDNVYFEQKATPDLAELARKMAADESLSSEIREMAAAAVRSGDLDKSTYVTNEVIAKQLDEYVEKKIQEGIRKGILKPREDEFTRKIGKKMQ